MNSVKNKVVFNTVSKTIILFGLGTCQNTTSKQVYNFLTRNQYSSDWFNLPSCSCLALSGDFSARIRNHLTNKNP